MCSKIIAAYGVDSNGFSNGVNHEYNPPGPRSPDHQPVQPASVTSVPVFVNLDGCNVGFKHWHPTSVTSTGNQLAGQGELGGVWEWTSTPFTRYEGFKAMEIYPGYSGQFAYDSSQFINLNSPQINSSSCANIYLFCFF